MHFKVVNFVKNFYLTLISNFISLVISTLVILIIPKLIGVEEYGYWQLYLFYSLYVGFLHFGWSDGIYLRYGGEDYNNLDKRLFFSQFYMMSNLQLFIALILIISTINFIEDGVRVFIFLMVIINLIIINISSFLLLILQATNRIKESAYIVMISRIVYILLIVSLLLIGIRDYRLLIISDLIGKLISLIYAVYSCRDIVLQKFSIFMLSIKETVKNISVGIKLMFANIASLLIIGVVRFGIEKSWDVATFGKVSLALSVSNLLMLFINAIGVVLFPILRNTDEINLSKIYIVLRDLLMMGLFSVLLIYFPLKSALIYWLPAYSDTFIHLVIIFPIIIYEGKLVLLVYTYMKTLRKEIVILRVNIFILVLSVIITFITTVVLRELNLAIASILLILGLRSIISEWYLSKIIQFSIFKNTIIELGMILIFITVGWYIDLRLSFILYLICYIIYLFLKRKDILLALKKIKKFLWNAEFSRSPVTK